MSTAHQTPVALGLIGMGRIAFAQHLPALRRVPALRVVAICDSAPQQLERAAALLPRARPYSDYHALLGHPGLEAVGILTPPQAHVELALAALEAGLHVFIEKPLAASLDESEALLARAAASPLKVLVGYNTRWHRLVRQARQMIRDGAVGRVQAIRSTHTHCLSVRNVAEWSRWRASSGGLLLSEFPHHLDLWRYLLGCEIEQVYVSSRQSPAGDDQSVCLAATLEGGVLASALALAETSPNNEVEVYGDQGRLCLSLYRVDGLQWFAKDGYPGDVSHRLRRAAALLGQAPQIARALRGGGDFVTSFAAMWQHYAHAIRSDAPLECTLEDGQRVLQAALAAAESARVGQPVRVAQAPRRILPTSEGLR